MEIDEIVGGYMLHKGFLIIHIILVLDF